MSTIIIHTNLDVFVYILISPNACAHYSCSIRSCASPFEVYSCSNMDDDDARYIIINLQILKVLSVLKHIFVPFFSCVDRAKFLTTDNFDS
jgi:hypothetical protein